MNPSKMPKIPFSAPMTLNLPVRGHSGAMHSLQEGSRNPITTRIPELPHPTHKK